jgi:hypothetical protein
MDDFDQWMNIAEARASASHDKDRCIGVFYPRAIQDMAATELEGRAVFHEVAYVEIIVPGTAARSRHHARATEEHKRRFPAAWDAYERKHSGMVDGTPIEQWPYLNVAQVAELKAVGVRSIEALAAVSDGNLKNLGTRGRELRERARQHLATGAGEVEKELRATIAAQAQKIETLEAQIDQLQAAVKGRAKADAA